MGTGRARRVRAISYIRIMIDFKKPRPTFPPRNSPEGWAQNTGEGREGPPSGEFLGGKVGHPGHIWGLSAQSEPRCPSSSAWV